MTVEIALRQSRDDSYDIIIDSLSSLHLDTKVAVVTNPTVAGFHLDRLLRQITAKELIVITVPDGEQFKNWETISSILDEMFEHRFNRKSMLIAFGGGVIGDMTGFASSIYQRGIDFIQIPTTLLSQVDASVGGKTGINNRFGKNLVGAFHQPRAVYIDPYFLGTLPKREFSAGVAEIVKMAVTFNRDFFTWLEEADLDDSAQLGRAIEQAVQTKARVVAADEKEKGIRAALNYGHTFGHVIENETGYTRYLHGEAVAIGMVMADELAVSLGWMDRHEADRIRELLERYGLPVTYPISDIDRFYETFYLDKKSADSTITFIIPKHLGEVEITDKIEETTIKSVLAKFEDKR